MCEMALAGVLDNEIIVALRQVQRLTDTGGARSQVVALSREIIARAPTCALGYYHLGKALLGVDAKASEQALWQCMERRPDDTTAIDALTHIGFLRRAAGDAEGARTIWSGVVAKYGNNPHITPTKIFFLQG